MPPFRSLSRRFFLGQVLVSLVPLPSRAEETANQDGFRILEARPANLQLVPEPARPTPVLGFNGSVPGPLLRYKKGEEIKIRLVNRLDRSTSLNWHGVRIVNAMDGVAGLTQDPVPPGGKFDYRFTPPDSGFYWYHPQVLTYARAQQARGLYGALIIDEENPPPVDRDLLIVLSDWTLDEKKEIVDFSSDTGPSGALLTVNSHPVPAVETLAPSARLRLRLLNAADSRIMPVVFHGITPMILAIDGQPCEPFEPQRETVPIGPGARFDILCDLPSEAGAEAHLSLIDEAGQDRALLQFKTQGEKRVTLPPIGPFVPNPLLPKAIRLEAAHRADLLIEAVDPPQVPSGQGENPPLAWKLNGATISGFAASPLFSVKRGAPVVLTFINHSGSIQAMRVHGHVLRLLHDLDDGWDPYWRDAVLIAAGRTKHVAFIADNPGKWAIEASIAGRQASGLASWFQVT